SLHSPTSEAQDRRRRFRANKLENGNLEKESVQVIATRVPSAAGMHRSMKIHIRTTFRMILRNANRPWRYIFALGLLFLAWGTPTAIAQPNTGMADPSGTKPYPIANLGIRDVRGLALHPDRRQVNPSTIVIRADDSGWYASYDGCGYFSEGFHDSRN